MGLRERDAQYSAHVRVHILGSMAQVVISGDDGTVIVTVECDQDSNDSGTLPVDKVSMLLLCSH